MTYLGPLRLHFAGQFQATVSTVNNDPKHFDNDAFRPEYQQQGYDGSWNPAGDADWRLLGCRITSATMPDGTPAAADDPVLEWLVADSDRRPAGKLVDLDPQQQMVSTIFGLEMRICDPAGETRVIGRFEPAPFTDLWPRAAGDASATDPPLGAFYQSVLTDLEWADAARTSPMLSAFRAAAIDGLLSVKFNVDGYDWTFGSETFGRGRVVGTIGVATAREPRHFVRGRHFLPTAARGALNACVAVVDEKAGKVLIDLGNALPTATVGGPLLDVGEVALRHAGGTIGTVSYREEGWYERTAGVVALPADRVLTADELEAIAEAPLSVDVTPASGNPGGIDEPASGLYARPDQFVYRLDAGETAPVRVFASRFGAPLAGAVVHTRRDPSRLQGGEQPPGQPPGAVTFPTEVTTGADGVAELPIAAGDPGRPRPYIDGQVYGVRPALAETLTPGAAYPPTPDAFVSLLVWGVFDAGEPPTWWGGIGPVLQRYANLYPVMDPFLDLASYESVCAKREVLRFAFGLPIDDPNAMPVTRDLSGSARRAILRWLTELGDDGRPRLGTPPTEAQLAAAEPPPLAAPEGPLQGKATAAARMIGEPPD
jgi:hypothetical protein